MNMRIVSRTILGASLAGPALSGCYGPNWGTEMTGSSSSTSSVESSTTSTPPTSSTNPWTTGGDAMTSVLDGGADTTSSLNGTTGSGLVTTSGTTDPSTSAAESTSDWSESTTGSSGPATGSTSDSSSSGDPPAEPFELSLEFSPIKQFDFSWPSVPGADRYELWERKHGDADYVQLGDDIYSESISLTMPLHLRFQASYFLRACSGMVCDDSPSITVLDAMASAVGYFKASNTDGGDHFGDGVALSGDGETLAVGAGWEGSAATGIQGEQSNNDAYDSGAVYVFQRIGVSWTQQAYIKASNTDQGDYFGSILALSHDGNTLAVGAFGESSAATQINGDQASNAAPEAGAVYVFTRSGIAWSQEAYIKPVNAQAYGYFSKPALSADGNTLAVAAFGEEAVHVYTRSNSIWTNQAHFKGSNSVDGDQFGRSIAMSADGKTLVVGAISEDSGSPGDQADNSVQNAGAAYVFVRTGDVWSQQAYIKASNPGKNDTFGESVALSADGNILAVGADGESSGSKGVNAQQGDDSAKFSGAVYVYTRVLDAWSQEAYIKASNTDAGDDFGGQVVLSADGSVLVVAAMGEGGSAIGVGGDESSNLYEYSGAAYVFLRAGMTWKQESYVKASTVGNDDGMWMRLALSADGNTLAWGAQYDDSAAKGIGLGQENNDAKDAGAVFLF